ncbi:hypothetical protein KZR47_000971 [Enterococcus faecalis]|uniref:flavodoxin n=1 Tax=Enterococcus faecalis TaxID=1351 RepID=UPI0001F0C74F|nr:cyclophilin-like fold protein [Enterococcus faecalis]EFT95191.1 hypothetical protein HMPREF9499_00634 [Enterococcus faecalis TX0012]EHU8539391.1 hypothetical protein [Enterococcus faecalis]
MRRWLLLIISSTLFFLAACSTNNTETSDSSNSLDSKNLYNSESKVLTVYFSYYENTVNPLETDVNTSASVVVDNDKFLGTTAYVAKQIREKVGGDIHSIKVETPYPEDFNETRDRNHEEIEGDILPELKEHNLDFTKYDTIFIGYPVWATNAPQAIFSFLKDSDLTGKSIIPFCTHDGYGSGSSYSNIEKQLVGSDVLSGIDIESSNVQMSDEDISEWLQKIGVHSTHEMNEKVTPIELKIDENIVEAVFFDTDLAKELIENFPLQVEMSNYGNREIYGSLKNLKPKNIPKGKSDFEDGDITYCEQNNTLAVFYAQTNNPDLSMDVVRVGRVTSGLNIFEDLPNSVEVELMKK